MLVFPISPCITMSKVDFMSVATVLIKLLGVQATVI